MNIPVTKPFLPPREEYEHIMDEVWERNWLTNNGPLVKRLEKELKKYLQVPHLNYVSNGTIALQIAIKALELEGQIITTPFSYVATTSSIVWEGCTPVFVDIDSSTFNIDPDLIEDAITEKTSAILATHVFGNPCDIDAIKGIADQYNLSVIYDAAHCFGTAYKGKSVYNYGDISTASFHATKLFHTVEGGGIFVQDEELNRRISLMRNFGHSGPINYKGVGINGKNSEFHAAMGICNLQYINEIMRVRQNQCEAYDDFLKGVSISKQEIQSDAVYNFSYYPVLFKNETLTLKIKNALEESDIFARRYFYPSLDQLEYVSCFKTPISDHVSRTILCLPLFHRLSKEVQKSIVEIVKRSFTV